MNPYIENNRQLWNQWTRLHLETGSDYQKELARFKNGDILIDDVELQEVGNVSGITMLHLMCHFGLASLSWARKGAAVTGIDFSEESIQQARALNAEYKLNADFLCSDVYNLPDVLACKFDIVYTSGGVLAWLPDLNRWARVVAQYLKPGGVFYLRDGHPFRRVMFPLVLDGFGEIAQYHYFSSEPTRLDMRGSYAQPDSTTNHPAYFWVHGSSLPPEPFIVPGIIVKTISPINGRSQGTQESKKLGDSSRKGAIIFPGVF